MNNVLRIGADLSLRVSGLYTGIGLAGILKFTKLIEKHMNKVYFIMFLLFKLLEEVYSVTESSFVNELLYRYCSVPRYVRYGTYR